jgi:hypothetical protein
MTRARFWGSDRMKIGCSSVSALFQKLNKRSVFLAKIMGTSIIFEEKV